MNPEQLTQESRPPHTGNMGEPAGTNNILTGNGPSEWQLTTFDTREPAYMVKPSWELLWGAIVAVVAAVALAVGSLSDGDIRNWTVVGGVIMVAAVRGIVGYVIQRLTTPRTEG